MMSAFQLTFFLLLAALSLSAAFRTNPTRFRAINTLHPTEKASKLWDGRKEVEVLPLVTPVPASKPPIRLSTVAPVALIAAATTMFLFNQPAYAATMIESIQSKLANSGFVQAFLLVFVSEIGDKTFFMAGILAAKYGRFISFLGSMGALAIMTVISTLIGQLFHAVPASLTQGIPYDDYIAVAAFAYFGLKTLYDASQLASDDNSGIEEEQAEAEEVVEKATSEQKRRSTIALLIQIFTLVFAAEIGDRSFLSTIALSAAQNPFAVGAGA
jgi:putative Ca2+/H+ antiporter (TMEM165/GDT1 family)